MKDCNGIPYFYLFPFILELLPFLSNYLWILRSYYKFYCRYNVKVFLILSLLKSRNSSVGRASASQAEGREFESRFPLQDFPQGSATAALLCRERTLSPKARLPWCLSLERTPRVDDARYLLAKEDSGLELWKLGEAKSTWRHVLQLLRARRPSATKGYSIESFPLMEPLFGAWYAE